ncbi:hypothetical protein GQ600_17854 [Phytophthora cactorum]|nr:hypothetical protein GQ600_17854 [Phytophthora cactorum]
MYGGNYPPPQGGYPPPQGYPPQGYPPPGQPYPPKDTHLQASRTRLSTRRQATLQLQEPTRHRPAAGSSLLRSSRSTTLRSGDACSRWLYGAAAPVRRVPRSRLRRRLLQQEGQVQALQAQTQRLQV